MYIEHKMLLLPRTHHDAVHFSIVNDSKEYFTLKIFKNKEREAGNGPVKK